MYIMLFMVPFIYSFEREKHKILEIINTSLELFILRQKREISSSWSQTWHVLFARWVP